MGMQAAYKIYSDNSKGRDHWGVLDVGRMIV
jgi:hypothetical protein